MDSAVCASVCSAGICCDAWGLPRASTLVHCRGACLGGPPETACCRDETAHRPEAWRQPGLCRPKVRNQLPLQCRSESADRPCFCRHPIGCGQAVSSEARAVQIQACSLEAVRSVQRGQGIVGAHLWNSQARERRGQAQFRRPVAILCSER